MGTSVELCRTTEGDVIVDNNGNVIISGIYDANKFDRGKDGVIIRFMTNDNEYSYINLSGLFFDKYSYEQYDMVCHILGGAAYKVKKDGKYGLTNEFRTLNCVYDEVTFLNSNTFICGDIIRLRRGSKYLLVHARREYDACAEYDYIYTPLQPLDKFIVCQDGKYGFIDSDTFEEIIEPTFYSIEDLCCQYNFDVSKYTKNLYVTDEKLKLVNKINLTSSFADSYFVDVNNLLNGKWGGKDEIIVDYETGETCVYKLYYAPIKRYLLINMYGYFYNLFDCRIYKFVVHMIGNLYVAKRNGKYGLINDEFHQLLGFCYKDIQLVHFNRLDDKPLFVVTYKNKQFLFNAESGMRTDFYDSLSWYGRDLYKNYLVYEEKGKFGLISPEGQIILKANYCLCNNVYGFLGSEFAYFQEIFHDKKYFFYIDDCKYFGRIPVCKYDFCIRISNGFDGFYIIRKDEKYGLLNYNCDEIISPSFDDMFFAEDYKNSMFSERNAGRLSFRSTISASFVIGCINKKFNLYYIQSMNNPQCVKLIISNCDEMIMIEENKPFDDDEHEFPYIYFKKNGNEGYVNEDGEIISSKSFDKIDTIIVDNSTYYLVYKRGKVGMLNSRRKILIPCVYDEILETTEDYAIVSDQGVKKKVEYNISCNRRETYISSEIEHYSIYSGSYAQYEMGYSDEDIDTIFDGDPDAYWNID